MPATDAEGAKGNPPISQAKGQNHHHRNPLPMGEVFIGVLIVCESLWAFALFVFGDMLSILLIVLKRRKDECTCTQAFSSTA